MSVVGSHGFCQTSDLNWLSGKKTTMNVIKYVADDIMIEILSRLPAEHIVKYREVCRKWRALTSTSLFAELHLQGATPSLFVQTCSSDSLYGISYDDDIKFSKFYICEESPGGEAQYSKIRMNWLQPMMQYLPQLFGSCNGLLLFTTPSKFNLFFIINPITREQLALTPPCQRGFMAGVYFHPSVMDYKLLCWCHHSSTNKFFIYTLGAKTWKEVTSFKFWPRERLSPAIVSRYLYWPIHHEFASGCYNVPRCKDAILAFNMDSEEFSAMPHPGHEFRRRFIPGRMDLFEMRGQLACCFTALRSLDFEVWVLEDHEKQHWVKRYSFCLGWMNHFSSSPRLFGIQNDELLFSWSSRDIYRYHIQLGTLRQIPLRSWMVREGLFEPQRPYWKIVSYTKSLITLK